jgi:hypothetical protein
MGNAVDCGRERMGCGVLDVLEKVESRLFRYELARSNFAREGGEVTSGGSVVRFAPTEVAEPGSLLGDKTSAAMSECPSCPRAWRRSLVYSSRCVSAEVVGVDVAAVMRRRVPVYTRVWAVSSADVRVWEAAGGREGAVGAAMDKPR